MYVAMERITQILACAPGQEITNHSTRAEYNHKRNQRRRWRKRKNGWITFEYNHQFPHPEIGDTEYQNPEENCENPTDSQYNRLEINSKQHATKEDDRVHLAANPQEPNLTNVNIEGNNMQTGTPMIQEIDHDRGVQPKPISPPARYRPPVALEEGTLKQKEDDSVAHRITVHESDHTIPPWKLANNLETLLTPIRTRYLHSTANIASATTETEETNQQRRQKTTQSFLGQGPGTKKGT